ncbi:TPA: hypothetical protein N0F65_009849 [Lagenidium giganteum]|uniref:Uncharacterized protein n=1 Tax=Lagenidium giganteum TaxID=4803 RepID=A0AAV2YME8_9STRA|nr:TPA: hypothetical protein N0F65_009849 [Lagenidium giganteum]
MQADGHSFSSLALGLGVDNVLRFEVVLADGTITTASACNNPDLFWALSEVAEAEPLPSSRPSPTNCTSNRSSPTSTSLSCCARRHLQHPS